MLKEMYKKKKAYYNLRLSVFNDWKNIIDLVSGFDDWFVTGEVREHIRGERSDHKECTKEIIRMSKLFIEISQADTFEEIQNLCREGLVNIHER